jgi:hypothetical protein
MEKGIGSGKGIVGSSGMNKVERVNIVKGCQSKNKSKNNNNNKK